MNKAKSVTIGVAMLLGGILAFTAGCAGHNNSSGSTVATTPNTICSSYYPSTYSQSYNNMCCYPGSTNNCTVMPNTTTSGYGCGVGNYNGWQMQTNGMCCQPGTNNCANLGTTGYGYGYTGGGGMPYYYGNTTSGYYPPYYYYPSYYPTASAGAGFYAGVSLY